MENKLTKLPTQLVPGPTPFASFREFFKLEAAGGVFLFGAAVLAMLLKFAAVGFLQQSADDTGAGSLWRT